MNNFSQMTPKPLMINLRTIARVLDVSTRTVTRMNQEGKIRLYRMGGKLFAYHDELLEDIKKASEPVNHNPDDNTENQNDSL